MSSNVYRCLILGHSFVRRLERSLHTEAGLSPDFNLAQAEISLVGYPGGTVHKLRTSSKLHEHLVSFQPHVIILQIGGNDLCDKSTAPVQIAADIVRFASHLRRNYGVMFVLICDIMHPRVYETRREETNADILKLVQLCEGLVMWRHKRMHESPHDLFLPDGCHLNSLGTSKFYRNLRLAIKHACSKCMARSDVCLVAALTYQVSAQCPKATACINRLGFNISSINRISGDFTVLCSNTSGIVHCYDLLTQCPIFTGYGKLFPDKNQMQTAIKTVCKNQDVLMKGFACVAAKPAFNTEITACETKVTKAAGNIDPNNLSGAVCGILDNLLNCVTTMPSITTCGKSFTDTIVTFEKELLPGDCPSGSPKVESWLLFAVLAALVSSIINRL